ncbi:hypothetical protein GCM10022284_74440 [Streptomyces hundungensis]
MATSCTKPTHTNSSSSGQKARLCGFIGQDKSRAGARTHGDRTGPALHLAGAVVVITAIGISEDGPALRASTPRGYRGLRNEDQGAAHRPVPHQSGAVTAVSVRRSIHAQSVPPATDTARRPGPGRPGHSNLDGNRSKSTQPAADPPDPPHRALIFRFPGPHAPGRARVAALGARADARAADERERDARVIAAKRAVVNWQNVERRYGRRQEQVGTLLLVP